MSQDYLHACERAELLGLPKPSEKEWRQTQSAEGENRRDDGNDDGALQDLDYADETAGRTGGKLDELNSILTTTQKKLNRFKTICGSLGTMLKVKVSSRSGTPRHEPEDADDAKQEIQKESEELATADEVMTVETSDDVAVDTVNNPANEDHVQPKQIDLGQKMGSHLDKLDSLITKAENAQYSMQHQTKQMRKIIKK